MLHSSIRAPLPADFVYCSQRRNVEKSEFTAVKSYIFSVCVCVCGRMCMYILYNELLLYIVRYVSSRAIFFAAKPSIINAVYLCMCVRL